jgi:hypothetical protein
MKCLSLESLGNLPIFTGFGTSDIEPLFGSKAKHLD